VALASFVLLAHVPQVLAAPHVSLAEIPQACLVFVRALRALRNHVAGFGLPLRRLRKQDEAATAYLRIGRKNKK
jgi:hypothetical protein